MLQDTFVIKNKTGLHARPASLFVKKAGTFTSRIGLAKDSQEVDAKSMISLLTLGAAQGDKITITVDGPDEGLAMRELVELLESLDD